jgi:hypothetical protein
MNDPCKRCEMALRLIRQGQIHRAIEVLDGSAFVGEEIDTDFLVPEIELAFDIYETKPQIPTVYVVDGGFEIDPYNAWVINDKEADELQKLLANYRTLSQDDLLEEVYQLLEKMVREKRIWQRTS